MKMASKRRRAQAGAGVARCVLAVVALLALAPARSAELIELAAGIHRIEAEVAADYPTRGEGLMHRRAMASQRGMLFVFPEAGAHCMWMRNTLIPLSVAFIDDQGMILNIEDMRPETEDSHCAAGRARFALEMNRGWFQARGIARGGRIRGLERAPPGR